MMKRCSTSKVDSMPKALLLENIHPLAAQALRDHGFEVETMKGALSEDELIDALDGVDLLGIRSKTTVTRRVLDARPTLTAIGCFCIGRSEERRVGKECRSRWSPYH